jgi:hypothetical protein
MEITTMNALKALAAQTDVSKFDRMTRYHLNRASVSMSAAAGTAIRTMDQLDALLDGIKNPALTATEKYAIKLDLKRHGASFTE